MKRRNFLKSVAVSTLAAPAVLKDITSADAGSGTAEAGLEITWLGGATMVLSFGDFTLLTDPCFGEGKRAFKMGNPNEMFDLSKGPNIKHHRRLTPFPGLQLNEVDQVILSHLHEDHFDQKAERMINKDLPILAPDHDLDALVSKGFSNLTGLRWGQEQVLSKGEATVTIRTIRADHSENPEIATILGEGNGYWFSFEQGDWQKSLYWTGDTFPTKSVLESLGSLGSPDIFIPHLGGVGTSGALGQISMGASHVTRFVDILNPGKILPVHHSTYELYVEPIHHLAESLRDRIHHLDLVSEGTSLRYI
ncbi:MAG: MBL fold metallo-hydrolase [Pseudomonadota bacterium]